MDKKLIIAIALSVLIILSFQALFPRQKSTQPVVTQPVTQPLSREIAASSHEKSYRENLPTEPSQELKTKEKETIIETGRYILTFTNIGGSLKDVKLKEYTAPKSDAPLTLVQNAEGNKAIFSMESNALIPDLEKREFTLTKNLNNKLTYQYSVPGKFNIIKEYYLYNTNNYIELRVLIQNIGSNTLYKDYDILGASSIQSPGKMMGRSFIEIDSMLDGKILKNGKVKNNEEFIKGIISWTGVKDRYFCIILKPQQDSDGVILRQFDTTTMASGVRTKRVPIYSGATTEDSYILYIGPNDAVRLSKLGFGLEQIINYGFFGGISKFLLVILRAFHKVTRNWGVAIIMLTCLINLALFPLTRKSFHSMHKIQEVQPHIEKLRKVHKDNPQKLNKELAELYRQYNINPFGGCLPLLLQMPIFIALYQGLMRSIELKGANFLWIKDLSNPDFVSLPFSLPFIGNQIHVLPLLMVVAMFFQQKISSKGNASASPEQMQQQKFMLIFFPIFFGFLFYNFPSGLVLYWLTNTVLMVIEHSSMRKTASVG